MRNIWFTSDTHFGHSNIITFCDRPFVGPDDQEAYDSNGKTWNGSRWRVSREATNMMDEALLQGINDNVKENDILWHLGDVCCTAKHLCYDMVKHYRSKINCRNINLVWGNHDHRQIGTFFNNLYDGHEIKVGNGDYATLSHYAMVTWNRSYHGSWQLYGHSHRKLEAWIDENMPGHRSMDVGVDNAYKLFGEFRPINLEEIREIMVQRPGFKIG